jgi:transposase
VDPRRLVYLDETGAKTNMTRTFARSQKGVRAVDWAPQGHWSTTTLVAGITYESAIAPMVLDGAMNAAAFEVYVEQVLIPALSSGAIVVMDNLSAHKSSAIARLLAAAGVELWYLPPYSPDFNPIELMWAKVKSFLRSAKARTQEELLEWFSKVLS